MGDVILKECFRHGETEHKFVKSKNRYVCVKCQNIYLKNKRLKLKNELVKYKGGKCEICGYDKCISALEFHHLDPSEKKFGISKNISGHSLEECKKEADKCILVCANCHREIHDEKYEKIEYNAIPSNAKKIDRIDIDNVKKMLSENKKRKEIADAVGVSLGTLKRFLSKNNLTKNKLEA